MFYQGMNTVQQQKALQGSPLWSAVIAVLNEGKDKLQIGPIKVEDNSNRVSDVTIVTNEGLRISALSVTYNRQDGEIVPVYHFGEHSSPDSDGNGWGRIKSTRVKYIAGKIRKENTEVNDSIKSAMKSADNFINNKLQTVLQDMISTYAKQENRFGSPSKQTISLDSDISTLLLRLVKNDISLGQLTLEQRALIDQKHAELLQKILAYDHAYDECEWFFCNDKWCVITEINGGIVVGAISKHPMVAAIEKMRKSGEGVAPDSDEFAYALKTVPFAWYKSLNDLPEEIKSSVEMELTMLKTHRNVDELIPKDTVERGHRVAFWGEMGACCLSTWGNSKFILLDKQG